MLTIYLNSKKLTFTTTITLDEILQNNGYAAGHFAIAINRQFIPRASYAARQLQDGDQIDIVTPMQGG